MVGWLVAHDVSVGKMNAEAVSQLALAPGRILTTTTKEAVFSSIGIATTTTMSVESGDNINIGTPRPRLPRAQEEKEQDSSLAPKDAFSASFLDNVMTRLSGTPFPPYSCGYARNSSSRSSNPPGVYFGRAVANDDNDVGDPIPPVHERQRQEEQQQHSKDEQKVATSARATLARAFTSDPLSATNPNGSRADNGKKICKRPLSPTTQAKKQPKAGLVVTNFTKRTSTMPNVTLPSLMMRRTSRPRAPGSKAVAEESETSPTREADNVHVGRGLLREQNTSALEEERMLWKMQSPAPPLPTLDTLPIGGDDKDEEEDAIETTFSNEDDTDDNALVAFSSKGTRATSSLLSTVGRPQTGRRHHVGRPPLYVPSSRANIVLMSMEKNDWEKETNGNLVVQVDHKDEVEKVRDGLFDVEDGKDGTKKLTKHGTVVGSVDGTKGDKNMRKNTRDGSSKAMTGKIHSDAHQASMLDGHNSSTKEVVHSGKGNYSYRKTRKFPWMKADPKIPRSWASAPIDRENVQMSNDVTVRNMFPKTLTSSSKRPLPSLTDADTNRDDNNKTHTLTRGRPPKGKLEETTKLLQHSCHDVCPDNAQGSMLTSSNQKNAAALENNIATEKKSPVLARRLIPRWTVSHGTDTRKNPVSSLSKLPNHDSETKGCCTNDRQDMINDKTTHSSMMTLKAETMLPPSVSPIINQDMPLACQIGKAHHPTHSSTKTEEDGVHRQREMDIAPPVEKGDETIDNQCELLRSNQCYPPDVQPDAHTNVSSTSLNRNNTLPPHIDQTQPKGGPASPSYNHDTVWGVELDKNKSPESTAKNPKSRAKNQGKYPHVQRLQPKVEPASPTRKDFTKWNMSSDRRKQKDSTTSDFSNPLVKFALENRKDSPPRTIHHVPPKMEPVPRNHKNLPVWGVELDRHMHGSLIPVSSERKINGVNQDKEKLAFVESRDTAEETKKEDDSREGQIVHQPFHCDIIGHVQQILNEQAQAAFAGSVNAVCDTYGSLSESFQAAFYDCISKTYDATTDFKVSNGFTEATDVFWEALVCADDDYSCSSLGTDTPKNDEDAQRRSLDHKHAPISDLARNSAAVSSTTQDGNDLLFYTVENHDPASFVHISQISSISDGEFRPEQSTEEHAHDSISLSSPIDSIANKHQPEHVPRMVHLVSDTDKDHKAAYSRVAKPHKASKKDKMKTSRGRRGAKVEAPVNPSSKTPNAKEDEIIEGHDHFRIRGVSPARRVARIHKKANHTSRRGKSIERNFTMKALV